MITMAFDIHKKGDRYLSMKYGMILRTAIRWGIALALILLPAMPSAGQQVILDEIRLSRIDDLLHEAIEIKKLPGAVVPIERRSEIEPCFLLPNL